MCLRVCVGGGVRTYVRSCVLVHRCMRGMLIQASAPAPTHPLHRLLKPQEDEVTQHYAVKTIENICSQGGDWAANFCRWVRVKVRVRVR